MAVPSCSPCLRERIPLAVVEKCPETGLFVGFVPGFPGAHTQGESLDELRGNLHEVLSMLLKDAVAARRGVRI